MHSIVTSFQGITKDASTDFYNVGDTYVQYGLSCIPCLCTADIIDRVVLIFDLDGPMGGMLTYEDVKKRYTEISGVEILYYPVVLSDMLLRNRCNLGCTGAEAKVIGNR